jgi:exoribonuclease R
VPARYIRLSAAANDAITSSLVDLRADLEIEIDFPPEVVQAATSCAADPRVPRIDRTDLPLVTIDPPKSMDLDQALFIERGVNDGYRVFYAIADVAAFVDADSVIDIEAHRRGQTLYGPDGNARLYPPPISENAASLLPGVVRPALLWEMTIRDDGEGTEVVVARALVQSREKLSYEVAQGRIDQPDSGSASLTLLKEVGELRQQREARLGGINLPLPEQVVVQDEGGYRLELRAPIPVEGWNAQISLMAGQAAAEVMLAAEVGVLRTLPRAGPRKIQRVRLTARALGIPWDEKTSFAELVRQLDAREPAQAALLNSAASLMRGSGYAVFDDEVPTNAGHAGVGAEYAHTTAPLRRLVDRYVGEVCVASSSGTEIPGWVRRGLPSLPTIMERTTRKAQQYEAGIISTLEAAVLEPSLGDVFEAVVVELTETGGVIELIDPPVTAHCRGQDLPLGQIVKARLVTADIAGRQVGFVTA